MFARVQVLHVYNIATPHNDYKVMATMSRVSSRALRPTLRACPQGFSVQGGLRVNDDLLGVNDDLLGARGQGLGAAGWVPNQGGNPTQEDCERACACNEAHRHVWGTAGASAGAMARG